MTELKDGTGEGRKLEVSIVRTNSKTERSEEAVPKNDVSALTAQHINIHFVFLLSAITKINMTFTLLQDNLIFSA